MIRDGEWKEEESGEDSCQMKRLGVNAEVEWRPNVFTRVTEHAAARTHRLRLERVSDPGRFSLCVSARPTIHPWD